MQEVVDMIQLTVAVPEKEMSGGASMMRQDARAKSGTNTVLHMRCEQLKAQLCFIEC